MPSLLRDINYASTKLVAPLTHLVIFKCLKNYRAIYYLRRVSDYSLSLTVDKGIRIGSRSLNKKKITVFNSCFSLTLGT